MYIRMDLIRLEMYVFTHAKLIIFFVDNISFHSFFSIYYIYQTIVTVYIFYVKIPLFAYSIPSFLTTFVKETKAMKQTDKDILRLAVPSIISNITVPLLGLADLAIVGHMGSEQYIAAIAVGTMMFNVIYWLFGFLRMGTSGMTSQALGREDHSSVKLLLRRSMYISGVIALCFLVLQVPLCQLTLHLIGPSIQIRPMVTTYFSIVIWGAPAMLGLYALNGWFIGLQNTKIPMTVAILQNIVNVVASLTLVFGLGMHISGVALGTLIAQWCGFLFALWHASRQLRLYTHPRHTDKAVNTGMVTWKAFFTVNRDIFLRTICLVVVNLFFTSAGARQGDMLLAVNTLLMTFFTLFSYVMDGFAFAGEALAGLLYGAQDGVRLHATVRRLFGWGALMVIGFTLVYVLGGNAFLGLLTSEHAVIAAADEYFYWACLIPLAGVAAFVYDGIFIGITATRAMLASSVASTVVFFVLFFLGKACLPTNHALWMSFIAYLAMRGLMQHIMMKKQIKF